MSWIFGGKKEEKEQAASRAEKKNAGRPAEKSVETEQIDQGRRFFSMGALALVGSAVLGETLPGCATYEDYTKRFKNNFDYCPDKQFNEEDLETANGRNQVKMNAEDCRFAVQKAMDQHLQYRIDIDDIFHFHSQGEKVTATNKILSLESQQALIKKYPFIKDISTVASSSFHFNYQFTTDQGTYLYFSINKSTISINDFGQPRYISMIYNTSDETVQTSPEYRDFQRTVYIGGKDDQGNKYSKTLTAETDQGVLECEESTVQAFSNQEMSREHIYETETLLKFLKNAHGTPVIDIFLKNVKSQNRALAEGKGGGLPEAAESFFSLINIQDIDQLIEIFKLLPSDPKIYGLLISTALRSHYYDSKTKDEYRDPITTLRSGWADCDDYAVINYFWAFLHRFNPNMAVISNKRNGEHHVLVWYRDAQNKFVVMDNQDVLVLDSSYSVEKYLQDFSANYKNGQRGDTFNIDYNGPVEV